MLRVCLFGGIECIAEAEQKKTFFTLLAIFLTDSQSQSSLLSNQFSD